MLTDQQIRNVHRLYYGERWPIRKIERQLRIGWRTIKKYLRQPDHPPVSLHKPGKLDPFKATVANLLAQDPTVSSAVIEQRLRAIGYTGGHSILRAYVGEARPEPTPHVFPPIAGERCQVNWGHFDTLDYGGHRRKVYGFALMECHSGMLCVEFTHGQSYETLARCHIHAFQFLGGVSREIWYDKPARAVVEHDGPLVRFEPRFLAFARELGFLPSVCHPDAGWEKRIGERNGIGYVRQNFWLARSFRDLNDVNRQALQWLTEIANLRRDSETGQRPADLFRPENLQPLPGHLADYRDTTQVRVDQDKCIHFDGNRYRVSSAPPGERLIVKADSHTVSLYYSQLQIATYARCWRRGQILAAERFETECSTKG